MNPLLASLGSATLGVIMFGLSIFLILLILVQRGKGGGLTGALGGPGGQSAFGSKAGDTFTLITAVSAVIWGLVCAIAMYTLGVPPMTASDENYETEEDIPAVVSPSSEDEVPPGFGGGGLSGLLSDDMDLGADGEDAAAADQVEMQPADPIESDQAADEDAADDKAADEDSADTVDDVENAADESTEKTETPSVELAPPSNE